MTKTVTPKALGAPLGLYSHGVIAPAGELVVVAGQVGVPPGGAAIGDVVAQTRQAFENVRLVLEAAGCTLRDVIRFQTFLTRADDIPSFVKAREEVFASHFPDGAGYPPNTLVVITRLVRPELLVEIEAMAIRTRRGHAPASRASARGTKTRVAKRTTPRVGSSRRRR